MLMVGELLFRLKAKKVRNVRMKSDNFVPTFPIVLAHWGATGISA